MSFLGEQTEDQKDATPFAPRCRKDLIEEGIFFERRDLFTGLDLVFFDTTSIYFEGEGGETLGQRGYSKDHRPDLNQVVVGVVIDANGKPVCCEIWPGNTTDVKTLIPVIDRIRGRFSIGQFCIVADRGMISAKTLKELDERNIPYILGTRMRKVTEIKEDVLSHPGQYQEVYPEGKSSKAPAPLKVKEVSINGSRYMVCATIPGRREKMRRIARLSLALYKSRSKQGPKASSGTKDIEST